jgi:hypothetical protein
MLSAPRAAITIVAFLRGSSDLFPHGRKVMVSGASIEETLELWAALLREVKAPAPVVHAGTGGRVGESVC